jgi:preprotein translocase subunit SecG
MNVLAVSGWLLYPTIALFIFVSILLTLIVLIQKGRGGGLSGAFGGGGGGNTAFGAKTGDVLTWATSIIFGLFVLLAIILNLMTGTAVSTVPNSGGSSGTPTHSTPATPPAQPGK